MKTLNVKDYDIIETEDVLEVLQTEHLELEDLYACGVYHAQTNEPVPGIVFGRILVELTRRLGMLEDQVKMATADPDRVSPRGRKGPARPSPKGPGTMHAKALAAMLPDDLTVGQTMATPCPACNHPEMVLKQTKDGTRTFLGCVNWKTTQCNGSISYKSYP